MRKNYEKPVLNASMTGTLEGVYAYASTINCVQPSMKSSGNDGGNGGSGSHRHGHYEKRREWWDFLGWFEWNEWVWDD